MLALGMLSLGLPTIAHKYGAHPVYEDAQEYSLANKRALLITTSEAVLEGREETSGSPQTSAFLELSANHNPRICI